MLHPHAKRALLIGWGEWGVPRPATRSRRRPPAARSTTTSCALPAPDELFHQAISSFLLEWAEAQRIAPTRSTSSATRGRDARTSSAPCCRAAPSRTPSRSRTPPRARGPRAGDAEEAAAGRRAARRPGRWRTLGRRARPRRRGAAGRRRAVRPRDRRRRAGRARGRGVRRLGGAEHAGGRRGRHRRPGGLQLPDPQLPRLPARASAAAASPSRRTSRHGSSARGSPSCDRDLARARGRPARAQLVRRRRSARRAP